MKNYELKRSRKIYEVVSITKLLSILLCGVIFFSTYGTKVTSQLELKNNYIDIRVVCFFCIAALVLMYTNWRISSQDSKESCFLKKGVIITEIGLFILAFSVLIYISGAYASRYKTIFLFIIITSTIELGKKWGVASASICSGIILTMDIIFKPININNIYFESDLVLSGLFILTAWLLGDYVEIEKKHREQLTNIANIDELTSVYNHRFFQQSMTYEIEKGQQLCKPVSLLFIDIDYFKNYNDLYGHLEGDRVLAELAALIKKNVRGQDIVARYGGEEFAVILPCTNEEEASSIGERIRSTIDLMPFKGEENLPKKKLTVSIGVSCFPDKAKTKAELINSADDALYRAKFFNKNRVEVYYSVLEELKEDIQEEHIDIISSIKTLISVINAKDRYTYGHTERVVIYCDLIANKLELLEEDRKILKYGAYLHDIGKIQIPQEILNKKMGLTGEEVEYIKKHPESGIEIIKSVASLKKVMPLILHHHERYDGKGYPLRLKGENIPYLTRILSVVDSFDAMTSNRPYQMRRSYEEAVIELKKCKSTQFDPDIVDVFVEVLERNTQYIE
ncbi:GGDEF/HD domain containing protein [Clostridium aceticum]|uniref:GGDEF/HD domain containing protein n=1 Tax=Clostridium aceticum TaxID=84022 RepID=A0A0D8I870_9CLOT|nr:diguanylate cyclase [Clostridium aceticum]AKL94662.1 GGDEF/HD domain containing protein [Clostridium aceticum]KJF26443.1 diguanylate cyclase [Clostridium aceticum]